MDSFINLPYQKQERITNAAMEVFAAHGYRKASVADIAKKAHISKAMIFTYFGSKKGCYEYMLKHMMEISLREFYVFKEQILSESDYFERIMLSVRIKVDILKKCPPLLAFATSAYTEREEEVLPAIRQILAQGYALREMFLSKGVDTEKFKNPQDAKKIVKIAEWISAGCASEWSHMMGEESLNKILADFIECISLIRKNFYKEQYI